jgi:hypothetical protein
MSDQERTLRDVCPAVKREPDHCPVVRLVQLPSGRLWFFRKLAALQRYEEAKHGPVLLAPPRDVR